MTTLENNCEDHKCYLPTEKTFTAMEGASSSFQTQWVDKETKEKWRIHTAKIKISFCERTSSSPYFSKLKSEFETNDRFELRSACNDSYSTSKQHEYTLKLVSDYSHIDETGNETVRADFFSVSDFEKKLDAALDAIVKNNCTVTAASHKVTSKEGEETTPWKERVGYSQTN